MKKSQIVIGICVFMLSLWSLCMAAEDQAELVRQNVRGCEDSEDTGTVLFYGEHFTAKWTLQNVGSKKWDSSYEWRFRQNNDDESIATQTSMAFPDEVKVASGDEYTFEVVLEVPVFEGCEKDLKETWELVNRDGNVVPGGEACIKVKAVDAPISGDFEQPVGYREKDAADPAYVVSWDFLDKDYWVTGNGWHQGEDWNGKAVANDKGDPVYAIGYGYVVYSGRRGGLGQVVLIRHVRLDQDGEHEAAYSRYSHLDEILNDISVGRVVYRGQQIGTVGETGAAQGSHLDFGIIKDSIFADEAYKKYLKLKYGAKSTEYKTYAKGTNPPTYAAIARNWLGGTRKANEPCSKVKDEREGWIKDNYYNPFDHRKNCTTASCGDGVDRQNTGYDCGDIFFEANQDIIIDDQHSEFSKIGDNWKEWPDENTTDDYRRYYYFPPDAEGYYATWTPNIPETGVYDVFVGFWASQNEPECVRYEIKHAYGTASITIDQKKQLDRYVWYQEKLGTFTFNKVINGGDNGYVRILNKPGANVDQVYFKPAPGGVCQVSFSPPELVSPDMPATLDPSEENPFTWQDDTNPEDTKYCIVVNDRGADLDDPEDDTTAYNTCECDREEYEFVSGTEHLLPQDKLHYDHDYTWTVWAIDSSDRFSQSGEWWNFDTILHPDDVDDDQDGYTENEGDCEDNDDSIHPGATEECGDDIDQDCDGSDLTCTDGLTAYWSFDNESEPGHDDSENGNNGTNHDAAWIPNGVRSGAMSFDGVDDHMLVEDHPSLNFGDGDFTVSFWTKPSSLINYHRFVTKYDAGSHGWIIYGDSGGFVSANVVGSSGTVYSLPFGQYEVGVWHLFSMVKTSSQVKAYRDGILVSTQNTVVGNTDVSENLLIGMCGSSCDVSNTYLEGLLDEVRIYNRALSEAEIHALYTEPPPVIHPIPDTGQTNCHDNLAEITCPNPGDPFYGQDAQYNINPQSYTKLDANGNEGTNPDGSWSMIKDNVTDLIWEVKQTNDGTPDYSNPHDADNTYTWYDSNPDTNGGNPGTPGDGTDTEDFIAALNESNFGGSSDWRLPTAKELASIVDRGTYNPAINTEYFPNTVCPEWIPYWSATSDKQYNVDAFGLMFYSGILEDRYKKLAYYARAVRGPRAIENNFLDNGDGTVTDLSTGLTWQQQPAGWMNWEDSLVYSESLSFAGHTDWRLPNVTELQSILDYTKYAPAIDPTAFPEMTSGYFWTSTSSARRTGTGWLVRVSDGNIYDGQSKSNNQQVLVVRGGQNQP